MPVTPEKAAELTEKRKMTVRRSFNTIIDACCDLETGAGVVLARSNFPSNNSKADVTAHFFKPRTHRHAFQERKITSAHERLGVKDLLQKILADEKAAKVAPHDLKVGDIISSTWGVTMRYVDFYRVIAIPHPRKVTLAPIPHSYVSGDWMSGSVMPDIQHPGNTDKSETRMVSMKTGEALVKPHNSISVLRKWDGNPVHVHSD